MKKIPLFLVLFVSFISCKEEQIEENAQSIIDRSILSSGVNALENSKLSFNFRDHLYLANRYKGDFLFVRVQENKDHVLDAIHNNGYYRLVNNKKVEVIDSMVTKYSESINSVHYFSKLPLGLNDKAVIKKLLPSVTIKGKDYHKVEITFQQDGGGVDYNDVFIYWFEKETFSLDYLAYTYQVNGGGIRFREAVNQRTINGVKFSDYVNYKPTSSSFNFKDIDQEYANNKLKKVSEINLENIELDILQFTNHTQQ